LCGGEPFSSWNVKVKEALQGKLGKLYEVSEGKRAMRQGEHSVDHTSDALKVWTIRLSFCGGGVWPDPI